MNRVDILVIALSVMMAWAVEARAAMYFVPDDFMGIQEALDESNPNDTIIVRNGTYTGPFFIYARNTTIASEYLLNPDPAYITNTIIRPPRGNREHRCFFTQAGDSAEHFLRMVGLTIALARAITDDENQGGGIYLQDRTAEIRDCIFKSCLASMGGAIYSNRSNVTLLRCYFQNNDALYRGRILHARLSTVLFQECDLGPSGFLEPGPLAGDAEIHLDDSGVELQNSYLHELGVVDGRTEVFSNLDAAPSRYVKLRGCRLESCQLNWLQTGVSAQADTFLMDSCSVIGNILRFGFFRGYDIGPMRIAVFTRNRFEGNGYTPGYAGNGLIYFGSVPVRFIVEENYFLRNDGSTASCVGIARRSNPLDSYCQRNYFVENRSLGLYMFGSTVNYLAEVDSNIFEYNAHFDNIGKAVYTFDGVSPTSYALHNFWGDSTGPYEATRNPGGLGDTTNAATIYDEWLQSEEEIPDTSLYPPPQGAEETPWPVPSMWYLANVYPNPFNGEFRVDLAGITGLDFTLKLYDILGREVALLRSGPTVRGTMAFQIPSPLAAGVYFLHARDHMYSETKKLLYLK